MHEQPRHLFSVLDFANRMLVVVIFQTVNTNGKDATPKKKDGTPVEITPLEKMLQNAGPLQDDGRDRFLGFENVSCTKCAS